MDPVTLTAGFVAAKTAIAACRSALETADDIGALGKHLDAIFKTTGEAERQKKKAEELSHNQKAVAQRLSGATPEAAGVSLSETAQQKVAELEAKEAMKSLERALNARFGKDTWNDILLTYEKKKAEAIRKKRAAAEAERLRREANEQFWNRVLVEGGKLVVLCAALGSIAFFLMWAMEQPK